MVEVGRKYLKSEDESTCASEMQCVEVWQHRESKQGETGQRHKVAIAVMEPVDDKSVFQDFIG